MADPIIVGIHGLLNKPPQKDLEEWWAKAITEGLQRNHNLSQPPPFSLAYWANIRNPEPIAVADLEERYEKAPGQGPLKRFDSRIKDKVRAVAQKWGGRVIDRGKDLIGIGENVEKLLGIGLQDLGDYYAEVTIRQQMRSRLSELLEQHQGKKILLIAHSMGSIIGYDVLRGYDSSGAVNVEHFITIGSPLGLPLVSAKIREEFGNTQTPKSVQRWTNIADPGDKVSLDCNLADEYKSDHGVHVKDVLIHNTYVNHKGKENNHKSYGYLRVPELSDDIRDFLASGV